MKRFAVLSALLLFLLRFPRAERAPSDSARNAVPSAGADDARMKALEEQVRSLAGEVALLRSELKEFRESKSPEQLSSPQLLLASTHPQPGTLASVPAPAAPQTTQTQTFGGRLRQRKTAQSGHQPDRVILLARPDGTTFRLHLRSRCTKPRSACRPSSIPTRAPMPSSLSVRPA